MSELQEFVKKRTANLKGISNRKLYGLEAFYISDKPFIVITSGEQIVVKVDDFEVKKTILKISQVVNWNLDGKDMENWFLLPDTFNKKKNKLTPILDITSKALLNPKKEKKKFKKKVSIQKTSKKIDIKKKASIFKRLLNLK